VSGPDGAAGAAAAAALWPADLLLLTAGESGCDPLPRLSPSVPEAGPAAADGFSTAPVASLPGRAPLDPGCRFGNCELGGADVACAAPLAAGGELAGNSVAAPAGPSAATVAEACGAGGDDAGAGGDRSAWLSAAAGGSALTAAAVRLSPSVGGFG
jgi:hypothetical protein